MILTENCVTTRRHLLTDKAERIEYIRNASTSHSDERLDPALVQSWIVELTYTADDFNLARDNAADELASGTGFQWDNCVDLWALEIEAL